MPLSSRAIMHATMSGLAGVHANTWVRPQASIISTLAPYLEMPEVESLLSRAVHEPVKFIGPPLAITGAERVYALIPGPVGPVLSGLGVQRRKESYACIPTPENIAVIFADPPGRARAADWAARRWPLAMQWDRSRSLITVRLCRTTATGQPPVDRVAHVGWLGTKAEEDSLRRQDYPPAQRMEQLIEIMTNDSFVAAEISVDKPQQVVTTNCIFCGGGLGVEYCNFCNRRVEWQQAERAGWDIPIPLRVAREFNWMRIFETAPVQAVKAHYAKWASHGYMPPTRRVREVREQRRITLREIE